MSSSRSRKFDLSGYDWVTIGLTFALIFAGWIMIFASEYTVESYQGLFDMDKNYGKQLIWISGAVVIGISTQFIDSKFFQTFAFIFYGLAMLLLFAVLFTKPINGATSWFDIAGFRLQPSEFAKTATNLALAAILAMPEIRMNTLKGQAQAAGIVALPTLLVLLQGDAGSTLIYASFLMVLFRAGLSAWIFIAGIIIAILSISSLLVDEVWNSLLIYLLIGGNFVLLRNWRKDQRFLFAYGALVLATYFAYQSPWISYILVVHSVLLAVLAILNVIKRNWQVAAITVASILFAGAYMSSVNYIVNNVLRHHQQERIWVWLRPEKCDPLGPLYNLEQSKFAIGSGGLSGKGFLEGERTKLDYVPEQSTDFIFCTVGEEWGFLGTTVVIGLFSILLLRILYIAERQRAVFAKFYAYGVAAILLFHFFVNIGMTMGVLPVIGIPLPFISYGGSSLISFTILIAILIKLDSDRMTVFR